MILSGEEQTINLTPSNNKAVIKVNLKEDEKYSTIRITAVQGLKEQVENPFAQGYVDEGADSYNFSAKVNITNKGKIAGLLGTGEPTAGTNSNDTTSDEEVAKAIAIAIASLIITILLTGTAALPSLTTKEDYIEITDPISGATTGFQRNPETGEYVSLDGTSIIDPDKVDEWERQRIEDSAWIEEENRKIREEGTELDKKLKEMKTEADAEIEKMQKEADKNWEKIIKDRYEMLKREVAREEKMAEVWTKQGDIFKFGEVSATVASVVADSAVDIYGNINPNFARGYKIIKGSLGGAAEKGWSSFVEGGIKGTADAMLVGTGLSMQNKACVRLGSRIFASKVGSDLRGENSEQQFNSLVNGTVDGLLHAGTGLAMDKLTGGLPKFKNEYIDAVKDWTTKNHVTTDTVKNLLGTSYGGAQRTTTRGIRDFIVKPYGTNTIKSNKKKIF